MIHSVGSIWQAPSPTKSQISVTNHNQNIHNVNDQLCLSNFYAAVHERVHIRPWHMLNKRFNRSGSNSVIVVRFFFRNYQLRFHGRNVQTINDNQANSCEIHRKIWTLRSFHTIGNAGRHLIWINSLICASSF